MVTKRHSTAQKHSSFSYIQLGNDPDSAYFILLKCTIQGVDEAWPTYFYKCVCPAGQTHPMLRNLSCSLNKLHLDKCQLANRLRIVASIYFTSAMNITQLLTWIENVNLLHHSVHFYSSSELSDRCSLLKWNK